MSFLLSAEFTGRMWACCYQIFCSIQIQIILTKPHDQWWGHPCIFNVFVLGLTVFACSGFVWVYSYSKGDACQLCEFFQYGADLPVQAACNLFDWVGWWLCQSKIRSGCGLQAAFLLTESKKWVMRLACGFGLWVMKHKKIPPQRNVFNQNSGF